MKNKTQKNIEKYLSSSHTNFDIELIEEGQKKSLTIYFEDLISVQEFIRIRSDLFDIADDCTLKFKGII